MKTQPIPNYIRTYSLARGWRPRLAQSLLYSLVAQDAILRHERFDEQVDGRLKAGIKIRATRLFFLKSG